VINNADRKGGHLIPMPDGHVYGVDHGICFHSQNKLRTVLWNWAGEPLTGEAVEMLSDLRCRLAGPLAENLRGLISRREATGALRRIDRLLQTGRHPRPSGDWPPVPWPPF